MPATFAAISSVLAAVGEAWGESIATAADFGAGTGAAGWAVCEAFPGLESIVCYERERNMRILGEAIMKKAAFPASYSWESLDITKEYTVNKADLVTASYMLGELSENERSGALEKLWETADKLLIITEPGTVQGYRNILSFRDKLIRLGAFIAAPCPHSSACPLDGGDWCHFSARTSRTKLHKQLKGGDAPFEDEKFCYIAAARTSVPQCDKRVIRHPQTESGRITLKLCGADGIKETTVTKKDKSLFKAARKLEWGDSTDML